ncbi:MAG: hypothetical protein EOP26_08670 [Rhodococcus sp. (in: high G+C Gram-positive bacteria)]|nr:MAG: hypothetical protein EOP26_08670 [Rhodococcus sp. (in: high G+C Gram-positive bacteria)]
MTAVHPIPTDARNIAAMTPSAYVTADTLQAGDPKEHEMVHLSSGDDKFTVGSPGDAFTLTKGWRGEYRVDEPLLKQFAIYVP